MHRITESIQRQPAITAALGICPLAANAATLLSAVTIGIAFALVMVLSTLSVSTIRNFVPHHYRMVFIFFISSTWVTCIDLLLQATLFEMRFTLDIYLPLITVNSLLVYMLEANALAESTSLLIKRALMTSAIVFFMVVTAGILRELVGHGTLLSDSALLFPSSEAFSIVLVSSGRSMTVFNTMAGSFIAVGLVISAFNFLTRGGGRQTTNYGMINQ